jgi:hypothetical protein
MHKLYRSGGRFDLWPMEFDEEPRTGRLVALQSRAGIGLMDDSSGVIGRIIGILHFQT